MGEKKKLLICRSFFCLEKLCWGNPGMTLRTRKSESPTLIERGQPTGSPLWRHLRPNALWQPSWGETAQPSWALSKLRHVPWHLHAPVCSLEVGRYSWACQLPPRSLLHLACEPSWPREAPQFVRSEHWKKILHSFAWTDVMYFEGNELSCWLWPQ